MKNESKKVLLVAAGAVLFNIIFWQEKLAVNSILFDVFILWSVFYLYPSSFTNGIMKWLLAAHIITLCVLVIHNTMLSKLAFSITLLMVVVFLQYLHRSVWYAAASAAINYLLVIPSLFKNIQVLEPGQFNFSGIRKSIRFLVIPFILFFMFFLLYNFANTVFKQLVNGIGIGLQHFFNRFFDWFSWQRAGFFCWVYLLQVDYY